MDVRSKGLFADIRAALRALDASGVDLPGAVPGRQRRRPGPPLRTGPAARTRSRAAAGSSTASPPNASCCRNCRTAADIVLDTSDAERPRPRDRHHRAVQRNRPGGAAAERHELRLQVRAAGGRQLRGRRPLHPQPALGAAAAPAHRPGQGRQRLRAGGRGRQQLRGTLRAGAGTRPGRATGAKTSTTPPSPSAAPAASTARSPSPWNSPGGWPSIPRVTVTTTHRDLGRE